MKISTELLKKIYSKYGNTFYILDSNDFITSYEDLKNSFKKFYPKIEIAYSYKTNYIPRICNIVNQKGGFAEVVSDMEYKVARKIGVKHKNIFYNGPFKNYEAIEEILINGGVVNADSESDIIFFKKIANKNQKIKLRLGIRCNFNIGDGVISRFGFSEKNGELEKAINDIRNIDNAKIVSLHSHFASRHLASWEKATDGMLSIYKKYFGNDFNSIEYISLGGGLYGKMTNELKESLNIYPPSFDQYAEVAAKKFKKFFSNFNVNDTPTLILEPGTALAANALKFVCSVHNIKKIDEQYIATLTGSFFNTNPTSSSTFLPFKIHKKNKEIESKYYENIHFAGYTCIETDYLAKNYSGDLSDGDFVVFDSAGSYSVVMKPPFILPNVPIVEIANSKIFLIKRQETFDDVFSTYEMTFNESF